jgi:hypothetical protein
LTGKEAPFSINNTCWPGPVEIARLVLAQPVTAITSPVMLACAGVLVAVGVLVGVAEGVADHEFCRLLIWFCRLSIWLA